MSYIHTESYRIRTHEIDSEKLITLPTIIQLMQEASMQQVINLGASVWDMEMDKKSWVLLRKDVHVISRPGLNMSINVQTYPSGFDKFFAYRDYKCFTDSGALFAYASSCWALVDIESRQLSRILPRFFDIKNPEENTLPRPNFKIPEIQAEKPNWTYRVSPYDLDWNNHLNNASLNKILLSAVPSEIEILNYQIHFKSEAFENDILNIYLAEKEDGILLKAFNASSQKVVALAQVKII